MFNLGSTADTLPLPGVGKTTMKLVFPLKGKLATCTIRTYKFSSYFFTIFVVIVTKPIFIRTLLYLRFQLVIIQQAEGVLGRLHHVH